MAKKKSPVPAPDPPDNGFPIVGIGASAGGLAAFEAFFTAFPADIDPGMAFVLVQHLAPDHKSILTDLIRRYTRMPVFEAADGMTVKPNCAYIIPPNRDMALINGRLQLLERVQTRGLHLPIDFFFRSLAQDQREQAICIVLSGTGSDGTLGIRAVKDAGGMVMAQNPESTGYDGMLQSAIATGLVDYVLLPAEMPDQLIAYVAHAFGKMSRMASPPAQKPEDDMRKIFILLRARTSHDFSQYKQNTIIRRIDRRMAVHQIDGIDRYVHYLQQTPAEVDALFRDLLIGVTRFFRDPAAFQALEKKVVPKLFAEKSAGAPVRVWVPGCSSGEEAYSIAILLHEQVEALKQSFKVQVFASDIDARAILHARAGIYPAGIAEDVDPERLARFFVRESEDGAYRIQKVIRDMLVFSEQNVIRDPPFSKLDLISCRNLLIYLNGNIQKKIIPLFHYALNPDGFLFLGTSETVGDFINLFAAMDRKLKLYQRKSDDYGGKRQVPETFPPPWAETSAEARLPGQAALGKNPNWRKLVEQTLMQEFAPVAALVGENGDILYLHGRSGRYLEPAPGEAGVNILKMAREGLRRELTTALHTAAVHKQTIRCPDLRVKTNGDFTSVHLTVRPVSADPDTAVSPGMFLVTFEQIPELPENAVTGPETVAGLPREAADADVCITALYQELVTKEEYLQTSIEELKSSNEEMQSINEEMQSTNEELETSKEELQSVNEELNTINAEMQQKVVELSRANNDMNNLMAGTGIGTVFVDRKLRILRFTPAAARLTNLILTDVGRPVGHIVFNLTGYDSLVADVVGVLETLIPKEVDVQTRAGKWYSLRIHPYRTLENVIEGAVITFVDISEIKRLQASMQEFQDARCLAVVTRDSNDAVMAQALDGRIMAWNPAAVRIFGWSEAEALDLNIRELIPHGMREEALSVTLQLSRANVLEPYRTQRITKDGRTLEVMLTASLLVNTAGEAYAISITGREAKENRT
jgi:two-component system CheB/CheR fusion protein